MRYLAIATMAASVLAIGSRTEPAVSLPAGGKITGADAAIHKVQQQQQQQDKGMKGPGMMGPGMMGPGMMGPGMMGPGKGGPKQGGAGGEGKMRGKDGSQLRSGESRGYTHGPRRGERSRVIIERDREGRRGGRGGIYLEPGYGYGPGCGWLRRRALETDSSYWWRRYRACRG